MVPRKIEELVIQQLHRSDMARRMSEESGNICHYNVVTISRRMGSGARIVAKKLSDELGWSLWDKDLLDAIAQDAHVSRRVVEAFDEKTKSEIELAVCSALGDYEMGCFLYPVHLARAVASVAKHGNAIILGRGANFLLPDALNIRIDASDHVRVKNMMTYEDLSESAAIAKLRESDKERQCGLIRMFGRERVEKVHYDLTIWMDAFTNDQAVAIIKKAIECRCAGGSQRELVAASR